MILKQKKRRQNLDPLWTPFPPPPCWEVLVPHAPKNLGRNIRLVYRLFCSKIKKQSILALSGPLFRGSSATIIAPFKI